MYYVSQKKAMKLLTAIIFFLFSSFQVSGLAASQKTELIEIEVSPGDTLSRFAERYLDEPSRWPELLEYNTIPTGDPNLIYPGDRILVPVEMVRDEIADFLSLQNQVRMRKSGQTAWRTARVGERLYPNDGVRTSANSSAVIEYLASSSYANIGENSLVFLRPEATREDVVALDVGQLRARDVKVLTDSAVIEPARGSDYTAKVDEEQTTTLSVFRGSVEFISAGEKITVDEGFMSRARRDAPPTLPVELPDPPEFKGFDTQEGETGSELLASSRIDADFFRERLNISEERVRRGEAEKIIMQVAADEEFSKIIIEREMARAAPEEFKLELEDGDYWWRAALMGIEGQVSRFSSPSRFTVNTAPPLLKITEPSDYMELESRIVTVQGEAAPGARVTINESPVRADRDGSFISGVELEEGENYINIKTENEFGRISEENLTIVRVPPAEKTVERINIAVVAGIAVSVVSIAAIAIAIMR